MQREQLHALYAQIIESTDAAIGIADAQQPDLPLVYANRAFENLTGYPLEEVSGKNFRFLQGNQRNQTSALTLREAIAKHASARVLMRNYRKDGSMFWNDLMIAPMFDNAGTLTHYFSVCADVSKEALRTDELEKINQRWSALLDSSLSMTFVLDRDGCIRYESGSVAARTGFAQGHTVGKAFHAIVAPRDALKVRRLVSDLQAPNSVDQASFDIHMNDAAGTQRYLSCTARNALAHPHIEGIVIVAQDVSAQRAAELQLLHDARHDALTGLGNRSALVDSFRRWHDRTDSARPFAILWILDLDQFKALNDSYGHSAGDLYLQKFAHTLASEFESEYTIARLGGDEFALFGEIDCPQVTGEAVARKLLLLAQQPALIEGNWVSLSASVGIAHSSNRQEPFDSILRNADIALFKAKDQGRNTRQFFDVDNIATTIEKFALRRDLPNALANSEFRVFYQPIVDGRDGRVRAFEMLLRWQHPKLGLLNASEFIAELDVTGLTDDITRWVLNTGCIDHKDALARGDYRLALNVWSRSFRDPKFAQGLADTIAAHGLPAHAIEVEITEGEFVLTALSASETIRQVAQSGIRIVIDDFGKGFSNFNYLIHFPIHAIKIDREFTQQIGIDPRGEKLMRLLISLAKELELDLVAEGVETKAQRDFLIAENCTLHQGYYYAKAHSIESVKQLYP
jgi:diguanylate cyclase (GGDEF)-like protein/PAS domain S-box-containing protein